MKNMLRDIITYGLTNFNENFKGHKLIGRIIEYELSGLVKPPVNEKLLKFGLELEEELVKTTGLKDEDSEWLVWMNLYIDEYKEGKNVIQRDMVASELNSIIKVKCTWKRFMSYYLKTTIPDDVGYDLLLRMKDEKTLLEEYYTNEISISQMNKLIVYVENDFSSGDPESFFIFTEGIRHSISNAEIR